MGNRNHVIENREARYNYSIEDTMECGLVLKGNIVKSVNLGMVSIKDSWISVDNNELYLKQAHITVLDTVNDKEVSDIKLLAHKREIKYLERKTQKEGYTIVPLKIYFKDNRYKMLIGVGKGKKLYDKRASKKANDLDREARRIMKENR